MYDPVAGEPVDVPGHWADVPDSRLPKTLDDGRVLVESDMRPDPVEGVQGSYRVVDPDEECPECGLPGLETAVLTLPGEAFASCPTCDWHETA